MKTYLTFNITCHLLELSTEHQKIQVCISNGVLVGGAQKTGELEAILL
jgi:hypothetical protein